MKKGRKGQEYFKEAVGGGRGDCEGGSGGRGEWGKGRVGSEEVEEVEEYTSAKLCAFQSA